MAFPVIGGAAVSSTGTVHLIAGLDLERRWFVTGCGLWVAPHQGWGRAVRPLERYHHCQRCSL